MIGAMTAPPPAPAPASVAEERRSLAHGSGRLVWWRRAPPGPAAARGAVLLLHGLASNATRWAEFAEATVLVREHAVLRVDLRGHGESQRFAPATLEHWCDDLAAVLDADGERDAVVVGHSLGAQVALHFAARHPARVRALVLVDPLFRDVVVGRARRLARVTPLLRAGVALVHALNRLGLGRRTVVADDLRALDAQAREALRDPAAEAAFVARYSSMRGDLHQMHVAQYLQDLVQMFRPPPDLAAIGCPVLALLSTGATFAPLAATRARLATLPRLETAAIECHHWPLTERPREVREAVERWVLARAPA
jgi:pimeloyl-ACP methyl ester carboxylesterase